MAFMCHSRFLASSSPTTTESDKIQFFKEITHEHEMQALRNYILRLCLYPRLDRQTREEKSNGGWNRGGECAIESLLE